MDDFFDRFIKGLVKEERGEEEILNDHMKACKYRVPMLAFHMSFGENSCTSGHCLN